MSSACFPELARLSSSSTNSKWFSGISSTGCMGFENHSKGFVMSWASRAGIEKMCISYRKY
jgi:hypothetical protein